MLDNVYTTIASGVTAEAPKLAIAAAAIIAIRFGLPFALSVYRQFVFDQETKRINRFD